MDPFEHKRSTANHSNNFSYRSRGEYLNDHRTDYTPHTDHLYNISRSTGMNGSCDDNNYYNDHQRSSFKHHNDSRHRFKHRMSKIRSKSAERIRFSSDSFDHYVTAVNREFSRKPIFSTKLTERIATENSSIKLTCNIIDVDSQIKWLKNNREIPNSSRYRNVYRDGLAMLEIFQAQRDDSAEYTCVARNHFGTNSCSSRLKVFPDYQKRPMPPIFTRAMKGKRITTILLSPSQFNPVVRL